LIVFTLAAEVLERATNKGASKRHDRLRPGLAARAEELIIFDRLQ